ncbi:MAG: TonB family protein [Prevotella sp.]|nr:TonB family protein [Prevotella sp.]
MMFVYQLKVGLCLIVFYLLFKWLLSRETFHRFNRAALLSLVVLSLVLPMVNLTVEQPTVLTQGLMEMEAMIDNGVEPESEEHAKTFVATMLAYLIYAIGCWVFLFREWWSYHKLRSLMRRGRIRQTIDGVKVHVVSDQDIAPFSWFGHIIMSEEDYEQNRSEILSHEMAHIRRHHSWDVVLMNVLCIFQWCNPAAWLIRQELQQVHEYEADQAVLAEGFDARQYQLLLIRKSVGDHLYSMANNLNQHSLRRRIRMMSARHSNGWQRLRLLAALPLAIGAVVVFAHPKVQSVMGQIERDAQQPIMQQEEETFDVVEQMPTFPGGNEALTRYLTEVIDYPEEALKNNISGRAVVSFVVTEEGWIESPKIIKSIDPLLDQEALRVVSEMPRWTPGLQNGKPVRVRYYVPITFKQVSTVEDESVDLQPVRQAVHATRDMLIIIDGQETSLEALKALEPNHIKNVNIVKGPQAAEQYGEKARKGAIIVEMKQ